MWPNIALLVALLAPVQNSSQPQTPYQLGSGSMPLYQSLELQNQSHTRLSVIFPLAQSKSQDNQSDYLGPLPAFQGRLTDRVWHMDADDLLARQNSNMCFAIRSYIFKRNDSKAPVLVKTMTCTPNTVFLEKAGPSHKPRLVPAN